MTPQECLKSFFGYDSFRGGQETLVNAALAGNDVLGILPTGAGKSICYQVPALMMSGLTIIVSPLISLMKNQVNDLTRKNIPAAFLNSSLTDVQLEKAMKNAVNGDYKIIYVAPERLFSYGFLSFANNAEISMLTVDEAHCVSQWGHDFRPAYVKIGEFVSYLHKRPVVSAFTATATKKVRDDIIRLLRLNNPTLMTTGFDRSNLYIEVYKTSDKFEAIRSFLEARKDECGVIYCSTRGAVEEVCLRLKHTGFPVTRYHAGLPAKERQSNQDAFLHDKAPFIVATNAFGMGIDKPNVSFVIHYNMPLNIEAYYQEAGRAGRNGMPASCILLYDDRDVQINIRMIEHSSVKDKNEEKERQRIERERALLREMLSFCTTTDCLRAYILKYFGEKPQKYCGFCSNCGIEQDYSGVFSSAKGFISRLLSR